MVSDPQGATQPWELIVTRSRVPVVRAGHGLMALFFLAISIGLLYGFKQTPGMGERVFGVVIVLDIWFWTIWLAAFVSRITVANDVMTVVTTFSSTSYRLSDIEKVRFLSMPSGQYQMMWLKAEADLVGHFYHYAAFGLNVLKVERELRQIVNEVRQA